MQDFDAILHEALREARANYNEILSRYHKEKEKMQYDPEDYWLHNIKNELKPTICESCKADGERRYGSCEECLKNQAYNKEYIETHLFVVNPNLEEYHEGGDHNWFKQTKKHLPGEKPFLYYGIEVEVEMDNAYIDVFHYDDYEDYTETSEEICEILQKVAELSHGIFVFEKDGSLNNGFEMISSPMSYGMWTSPEVVECLKNTFAYLQEQHALINQPTTNGMHVHISKKFFDYGTCKRERREQAYEDMDWLFQFFQPELEKLGGREYTGYCASKVSKALDRYGIGNNSYNDRTMRVELEVKGKLKKGGEMASGDHYSAVSLSGPTIEGRIFKSTVDYKHILANIEIMRNFSHAVRDGEIVGKTLNDILHTKDNLYLDKLIKKVRENCFKNKEEFSLDRVATDEIEIK